MPTADDPTRAECCQGGRRCGSRSCTVGWLRYAPLPGARLNALLVACRPLASTHMRKLPTSLMLAFRAFVEDGRPQGSGGGRAPTHASQPSQSMPFSRIQLRQVLLVGKLASGLA